jgi:acetyltransferase-like isoleucine patch superfamily enzyme
MSLLTRITNRLTYTIYYLFNASSFKKLHLKAAVKPSVRIEGKKYISIGKNVTIRRLGWLLALKIDDVDPIIEVQEGVEIGDFCHIACVRNIVIEKDVIIAHGVYISDNVHDYSNVDIAIKHQPVQFKGDVVIGTGSWIGEHVCIIGAKIGRNCVIGANVVLTKDVPDYTTVLPSQKIEWNYYSK